MQLTSNTQILKDYHSLKDDDILFRTYSYKDGKTQEKTICTGDCVEISLESFTLTPETANYEDVIKSLHSDSSEKIASLGNRYFYETSEIMKDYYNGKLSSAEVKNILKEYVYHTFGAPSGRDDSFFMTCFQKQRLTGWMSGLYEHFSRANTRSACSHNMQEGRKLMEENGMQWSGTYYYNSDWYYACEEMQKLFQDTINELSGEYGTESVDFAYVEKNTRFTLDGGITYQGVWESMAYQNRIVG